MALEPPASSTITGNSSPYATGDTITLVCVVVGGNPPPVVQWYQDGNALSGETSSTLAFSGSAADGGDYTCSAANSLGQVTSPSETIIVTGMILSGRSHVY